VPPSESLTEPTPPQPVSASETFPPPSANGDDETALARLADDGGPPTPPAEAEATLAPPTAAGAAVPIESLTLEQRVRRLEDALLSLHESRATETRPVAHPVEAPPAVPPPVPQPTSTAVLLDVGKRLLGVAAQTVPPAPLAVPNVAHPGGRGGLLWLLWDTWAEARIIARMFVDPRYHLPWPARVLPLFLLAAILTSYYWIPGTTIPLLGSWINKAVDLLLAFFLFKWLGHEARRYRQTSPDLPSSLRL
jgi:hypothetical protein